MPQNAKFSLDDALALTFLPQALMSTTAAHKLLDQDGHSPLTSPRRKAICKDIKIQKEKEQFHFGSGSHHSHSSQATLFLRTGHFVDICLGELALGGGAEGHRCVESNHRTNPQP